MSEAQPGSVLIVGASRGLGHAMVADFAERGWTICGTVRDDPNGLQDLVDVYAEAVEVEHLDITDPAQIAALRERLDGRVFDIVFINAGTANHNQEETIAEVSTEEFIRVMLTNALGVMRAVEGLQDLAGPTGTIGVMSSGQGSVANNTNGGHEVYRGSKAALNQYMRSYAARHKDDQRPLVLMAPGWVRTELGGPEAPLSIADSIPKVVDVVIAQRGKPGLRYLDRDGKTVPW